MTWEFVKNVDNGRAEYIHSVCGQAETKYKYNFVKGQLRCNFCRIQGYKDSAKKQGWTWLEQVDDCYSVYEHTCGAKQTVAMSGFIKTNVVCHACRDRRHQEEAAIAGFTLLEKVDKNYARYSCNKCGCESNYQLTHIRRGGVKCSGCWEAEVSQVSESRGWTFKSKDDDGVHGSFTHNSCGADQVFRITAMRKGQVKCRHCYEEDLKKSVKEGWTWLSRHSDGKSNYMHVCGNVQSMQHSNMQGGHVRCKACQDSWTTRTTHVYVMLIKSDITNLVKVGFAHNLASRVKTIKTKLDSSAEVIWQLEFDTGLSAQAFEKSFHKQFDEYKIHPEHAKTFISNGFTECYPMTQLDNILGALDTMKQALWCN